MTTLGWNSMPLVRCACLWSAKLVLGAVFVVAGAQKMADPAAFAQEIANYQLLPALAPYLATVLPGIEVVLGLVLMATPAPSRWLRASALLTAGLMVVFTLAVTSVVVRGIDIDCGCFGTGSGAVTWTTVARDVVLLGLGVLVLATSGAPRPAPGR